MDDEWPALSGDSKGVEGENVCRPPQHNSRHAVFYMSIIGSHFCLSGGHIKSIGCGAQAPTSGMTDATQWAARMRRCRIKAEKMGADARTVNEEVTGKHPGLRGKLQFILSLALTCQCTSPFTRRHVLCIYAVPLLNHNQNALSMLWKGCCSRDCLATSDWQCTSVFNCICNGRQSSHQFCGLYACSQAQTHYTTSRRSSACTRWGG